GYPGGPVIDRLSSHGDPKAVRFTISQIKHADRNARERSQDGRARFDFSYSGIKTAVLRYVETHNMSQTIENRRKGLAAIAKPKLEDYLSVSEPETRNLVASFQRAMVEDLVEKTLTAADYFNAATLFVTGGVAANNELRARFEEAAA